jgi:hypothetical protein
VVGARAGCVVHMKARSQQGTRTCWSGRPTGGDAAKHQTQKAQRCGSYGYGKRAARTARGIRSRRRRGGSRGPGDPAIPRAPPRSSPLALVVPVLIYTVCMCLYKLPSLGPTPPPPPPAGDIPSAAPSTASLVTCLRRRRAPAVIQAHASACCSCTPHLQPARHD